jgi:hypothetical protein
VTARFLAFYWALVALLMVVDYGLFAGRISPWVYVGYCTAVGLVGLRIFMRPSSRHPHRDSWAK